MKAGSQWTRHVISIELYRRREISNDALQRLWQGLRSITAEEPIISGQAPRSTLIGLNIEDGNPSTLAPCQIDVGGGGIYLCAGTYDNHEVDLVSALNPLIDGFQRLLGQRFTEPDDTRTEQAGLTGWTVGQGGGRNTVVVGG
jgi:hypothetical protein